MVDLLYASCPAMLFSRYASAKKLIFLLSGLICVGLTYDVLYFCAVHKVKHA